MPYTFDIFGAQLLGERELQEDNYLFVPLSEPSPGQVNSLLAAFADGMGGHAAGDLASLVAVKTLVRSFLAQDSNQSIPATLADSLNQANTAIEEVAQQKVTHQGMGCTLLAVVADQDNLWWVSVGDSRLYLLRQGKLQQLNEDHSYGGYLKLMKAQGVAVDETVNGPKNLLFSALTGKHIERIDLPQTPMQLQANDRIIIASDGLDTLAATAIPRLIKATNNAQAATAALLEAVVRVAKPNQDNTTVMVIAVNPTKRPSLSRRQWMALALVVMASIVGLGGLGLGLNPPWSSRTPVTVTDPDEAPTLGRVLQGFTCAQLEVQGTTDLRVTGQVASADDQARLVTELQALAGVAIVDTTAVQILAPPLCELLGLLRFSQNQSAEQAVYLNLAGHATDFRHHETLTLEIKTPATQATYLYVDYYQNDGTVVHWVPSPTYPLQLYPPATSVTLGQANSGQPAVKIAPPFGRDVLVVIATPEPLFSGERPNVENYLDYRPIIAQLPDSASSAHVIIRTLPE